MKRKIYQIGILLWTVIAVGCNDFLKESSLDEVRPGTTNDLEQLMLGEGYLRDGFIANYLDLMTDDVESNYTAGYGQDLLLPVGAPVFSWRKDMFERLAQSETNGRDTWEKLYGKIKGCNVILDMLGEVTGSEESKLNLRGQALAMRAFYYFMLVNLYGQPYNAEGVDITKSLGVPLILEAAVKDDFPVRTSIARVYAQIEKDLLEAAPLIEKYGQNNYKMRVTDLFVHTLLSRMYLYMENWGKVIEHADYVINRNPLLVNLADYTTVEEDGFGDITVIADKENGSVYHINSTELIWGYSGASEYTSYFGAVMPGELPAYTMSKELSKLYTTGDLRRDYYYIHYFIVFDMVNYIFVTGPNYGQKSPDNSEAHPKKGMRVAELYLNRAEANIQLSLLNNDQELVKAALRDLNFLRAHRFLSPYVELEEDDISGVVIDKQEGVPDLLQFCREERRRELSFEDHRWFDLKRYGMPELIHVLSLEQGQSVEYRLPAKGARYVLPIPQIVLDRNPALIQNP